MKNTYLKINSVNIFQLITQKITDSFEEGILNEKNN